MIIYVRTLNRINLELEIEATDSILSVKDTIFKETKVLQSLQVLIFAGKILKELFWVWDYNLSKESTITMIPCVTFAYINKIQITTNNRVVKLNFRVWYSNSVEDIKFLIQDETGIPWESIHLYYEDIELNDQDAFIDYIFLIFWSFFIQC